MIQKLELAGLGYHTSAEETKDRLGELKVLYISTVISEYFDQWQ